MNHKEHQRRYFVPCPRDPLQALARANVKWTDKRPETARYQCEACGELIENFEKTAMRASGEWRPTAPGNGR